MSRIEDPKPTGGGPYTDYVWPVVATFPIETVAARTARAFADVFEGRRSARELNAAPRDHILSALLYATAPRFWKDGDVLRRSLRPALSCGALHPISILMFADVAVFRVNADACALEQIAFPEDVRVAWLSRCAELLPNANGVFLVLVADMARPRAAYDHSESLPWRDAGALLQTLAYSAEVFELGFCPMGIVGNEVVAALPANGQLIAVGGAAIGLRE